MCLCLIIGIGTISIAILKTKENNELDEITFIGGYNVVFKGGNSCGNLVLHPAIIIDSKLEIISGDGSKNSPFELKNY